MAMWIGRRLLSAPGNKHAKTYDEKGEIYGFCLQISFPKHSSAIYEWHDYASATNH